MCFIGFANNNVAYRLLGYKFEVYDIHVKTILEFNNAKYFENVFPYKESQTSSSNKRAHDELSISKVQEQILEHRRGSRTKIPNNFRPNFITFITIEELQTYKKAITSLETPF